MDSGLACGPRGRRVHARHLIADHQTHITAEQSAAARPDIDPHQQAHGF
jgi:hypothetical protein